MKKIFTGLVLTLMLTLTITGCGGTKKNLSMSAKQVVDKIYEGINEDNLPMMLQTIDLNKENIESYIGTDKVDFKEAVASESGIGSIPYSVVVVKLNSGADVENAKKLIKDNAPTRKWICVEAEQVVVENNGDTIILIMVGEDYKDFAPQLEKNFKNLK